MQHGMRKRERDNKDDGKREEDGRKRERDGGGGPGAVMLMVVQDGVNSPIASGVGGYPPHTFAHL